VGVSSILSESVTHSSNSKAYGFAFKELTCFASSSQGYLPERTQIRGVLCLRCHRSAWITCAVCGCHK